MDGNSQVLLEMEWKRRRGQQRGDHSVDQAMQNLALLSRIQPCHRNFAKAACAVALPEASR